MSAQHLRDLNPERRHAVLAATVLHLSRHLTDCAIDVFKKLIGALTRRADNQATARITRSVREVQKPLRDVSKVCHAIIEAREKGEDIGRALERIIQWPGFDQRSGGRHADCPGQHRREDRNAPALSDNPKNGAGIPVGVRVSWPRRGGKPPAGAVHGRRSVPHPEKSNTRQGAHIVCAERLDASHPAGWQDRSQGL